MFHEAQAAAGYQNHPTDIRYTVPVSIPDQTPEIRIHCVRLADRTTVMQRASVKQTEPSERSMKPMWILIPAGVICLAGIIVIVKTVSKRNENIFKND